MLLEVSVNDQLAPFLWACGKIAHHGRNAWWNKTAPLMAMKWKRKKKETRVSQSHQDMSPQWPKDLSIDPTHQRFHPFTIVLCWDPAFSTWTCGGHFKTKLQKEAWRNESWDELGWLTVYKGQGWGRQQRFKKNLTIWKRK
jgi:hypothetical protein